jgi:hypothetical protein
MFVVETGVKRRDARSLITRFPSELPFNLTNKPQHIKCNKIFRGRGRIKVEYASYFPETETVSCEISMTMSL